MVRPKILILLNDVAGTGKISSSTFYIMDRAAMAGYEPIIYPIRPGAGLDSESLLRQYDGLVDKVICAGGDGTLNHVTTAVMHMKHKPVIGYLPAGSTNDFAAGLGIPSDPVQACDIVFDGQPFRYDVGKLNDRYFNYVAAFGAFSSLSYSTPQEYKNVLGHAAYVINGILELHENLRYKCHMKIESEEFQTEGDFVFGAVCNSSTIGGQKILKDANVIYDDGEMELFFIKVPETPIDLQNILIALTVKDFNNPNIVFRQVKDVKITADKHTDWTADGEFGTGNTQFEISVVRRGMKIMVPKFLEG